MNPIICILTFSEICFVSQKRKQDTAWKPEKYSGAGVPPGFKLHSPSTFPNLLRKHTAGGQNYRSQMIFWLQDEGFLHYIIATCAELLPWREPPSTFSLFSCCFTFTSNFGLWHDLYLISVCMFQLCWAETQRAGLSRHREGRNSFMHCGKLRFKRLHFAWLPGSGEGCTGNAGVCRILRGLWVRRSCGQWVCCDKPGLTKQLSRCKRCLQVLISDKHYN